MKQPPCQPDCPKRNAECHSVCPDYKEWRTEKDADNEKINKNKKAERDYWGHRMDYINGCRRKKKK